MSSTSLKPDARSLLYGNGSRRANLDRRREQHRLEAAGINAEEAAIWRGLGVRDSSEILRCAEHGIIGDAIVPYLAWRADPAWRDGQPAQDIGPRAFTLSEDALHAALWAKFDQKPDLDQSCAATLLRRRVGTEPGGSGERDRPRIVAVGVSAGVEYGEMNFSFSAGELDGALLRGNVVVSRGADDPIPLHEYSRVLRWACNRDMQLGQETRRATSRKGSVPKPESHPAQIFMAWTPRALEAKLAA